MKDQILWLDSETFSPVPIKHGTHKYAEEAEVMVLTYAFGDGPVQCWDLTDPSQKNDHIALTEAMLDPDQEIGMANGGNFDSVIFDHALGIYIQPNRILDTMVMALSHGLPGSLDMLCSILGVADGNEKHKTGKALIRLFCMPQPFKHEVPKGWGTPKARKAEIERQKAAWTGRATRRTHPEKWCEFLEYAKADITAMRAVYRKIPKWNYPAPLERALWNLDQKINQRGICIDMPFAAGAVRAADRAKDELAIRTQNLTADEVQAATQRDNMLTHILAEYGIALPDMQKATLERRIADPDLPDALRELLSVRLQSCSTSVSKYTALIRGCSSDGRLRGTIQFSGAQRTKRGAGRLFQPQNLPRVILDAIAKYFGMSARDIKQSHVNRYLEDGAAAILADSADFFFEDVMPLLANSIRGSVIAPKGKKLVVADLSNIEGRVAAWLASEESELRAYRAYDNIIGVDEKGKQIREGPDNYCVAYGASFGIDPRSVDKAQRQIGKIQCLFLQFGGGTGAFVTGAATYRVDLEAMAEKAIETISLDVLKDAESFMEWAESKGMPKFGLSDRAYIVCESFKRLWRDAHPNITGYWDQAEEAWRLAFANPREVFPIGHLKIQYIKTWMRVRFPDGSYIVYPKANVEENGDLTFMGINQYTRKWERITTTKGKLFENFTQALSRNIFYSSSQPAEDAGYEIVLPVHDEYVTEVPDSEDFSSEELSNIMAAPKPWIKGLPLAAAGFETKRYFKEV